MTRYKISILDGVGGRLEIVLDGDEFTLERLVRDIIAGLRERHWQVTATKTRELETPFGE